MTDRELERIGIIKMLIGSLEGVGESHIDTKVLKNIGFARVVLAEILEQIVKNARYDGFEASRQEIKEKSILAIEDVRELLGE